MKTKQEGELSTSEGKGSAIKFFTADDNLPQSSLRQSVLPADLRPYAATYLSRPVAGSVSGTRIFLTQRSVELLRQLTRMSDHFGDSISPTMAVENIIQAHFVEHQKSLLQLLEQSHKATMVQIKSIKL